MIIYKSVEEGWNKKTKILGITVHKRRLIDFKGKPYLKKNYLNGVFKTVENKNEIYFYVLGIRIFRKYKKVTYEMLKDALSYTERMQRNIYYDMFVLQQVPYLHRHFINYKRMYEGKDVVLVATGPTSKLYRPFKENLVHVGMNAGIYLENVKFDYVFANDYFTNSPEINLDIVNYKGSNCRKFYAVASRRKLDENISRGMNIEKIPQPYFYNEDSAPYLVLDSHEKRFAVNLECEPMGDIGGTAFSALQFIMYTNPKRVFLVGCDCGVSYSATSKDENNYDHHINYWNDFKKFADTCYPDTEIISINPVGLKGMFRDVYTSDFVEENPELMEECVEILDENTRVLELSSANL